MKLFREYGLVALLIVVAVGGYLMLGDEREDIFASAMDSLGQRLVSMVDDPEAKEKAAESFDEFRAKVASNEIAPEQVERIAANLLNLTTSGAKLSPEEADMVLTLSMDEGAAILPTPEMSDSDVGEELPAPVTPLPEQQHAYTYAWSEVDAEAMGSRLHTMVQFADKMKEVSTTAGNDMAMNVKYVAEDGGIKVFVDESSGTAFAAPEMKALAENLEKENVIVWEKNLRNARKKHIETLRAQRRKLESARSLPRPLPPDEARRIRTIERMNRLQEAGVILKVDSSLYNLRVDLLLKDALRAVESEREVLQPEQSRNKDD